MTPEQVERYARHLVLKEIGGAGQNALLDARIVIIGSGGLGGPAALYLAAAGIGHITLIDDDRIDLSNLQRQVQFATEDIGKPKSEILANRLRSINPDIIAASRQRRLVDDTAKTLLEGYDIILDGTDNFETRFAINRAALALDVPLVSGAVGRFDAQVSVFAQPGPCYRCLVPDIPPDAATCEEIGIIGALTGLAGSVMAMETIKIITGAGEPLLAGLWRHDALSMTSRTSRIAADPACPDCASFRLQSS